MKDFTKAQAARWVAQEFAKVNASNAAARLASERQMIQFAAEFPVAMPNSLQAHKDLAAKIEEAF
jgi:aminoglycoside phosphotransferase